MMPSRNRLGFAAVILAAAIGGGCGSQPSAEGSFDKALTVSGPIRIELTNGSGDSHVTTGPDGEIRIHGEIQVRAWSDKSGQRRVDEIQSHPPVVQDGDVVRIGQSQLAFVHDLAKAFPDSSAVLRTMKIRSAAGTAGSSRCTLNTCCKCDNDHR